MNSLRWNGNSIDELGFLSSNCSNHSFSFLWGSYLCVVIADSLDLSVNILNGDCFDGLNWLEDNWLDVAYSDLISLDILYDSHLLIGLSVCSLHNYIVGLN